MAQIRYGTDGGVARLVLDQPQKRNAMTFEMWSSLEGLVALAEADPAVRVIVLVGAGDRAFCAGADISQFGAKRDGAEATRAYDDAYLSGCNAVANAGKPTIGVIRGVCYGGGLGLAMSCDIRLARADARFSVPAAKLGLGYAYAGVVALVTKLGLDATADLLMSGRAVGAEEALRLGLASLIWSEDIFEREAADYVAQVAGNAPLTLRAVKQALILLARPDASRDTAAVDAAVAACFGSADYKEGRRAFEERRKPLFIGE
jgi:enoyl-CoA hydratase/carnithine racemase